MTNAAPPVAAKTKVKRSALYRTGKKLRPALNSYLAKNSLVGDPPVFDKQLFPWTASLEQHWEEIRQEVQQLCFSSAEERAKRYQLFLGRFFAQFQEQFLRFAIFRLITAGSPRVIAGAPIFCGGMATRSKRTASVVQRPPRPCL